MENATLEPIAKAPTRGRGRPSTPVLDRIAALVLVDGAIVSPDELAARLERFQDDRTSACWHWTGSVASSGADGALGTPTVWHEGRPRSVARTLLEAYEGERLGKSYRVRRVCQSRDCVAPAHQRLFRFSTGRYDPLELPPMRLVGLLDLTGVSEKRNYEGLKTIVYDFLSDWAGCLEEYGEQYPHDQLRQAWMEVREEEGLPAE